MGRFVSIHAPDSPADPLRFAYYDDSQKKVWYAVPKAGGGYETLAVDEVGSFSGDMGLSLAVDAQGYPIIAYMSAAAYGSGSDLKIARPAAASGKVGSNCSDIPPGQTFPTWQCETIDRGGEIAKKARFAAVSVSPSGLAMATYHESDITGRLKVAQQQYTIYMPLMVK